jgi:hypothetical protein
MKRTIFILSILLISLSSYAQDRKEVIEKGIQVKRNYATNVAEGENTPYLEKEEYYNFRGDLTEVKEFKDNGKTFVSWFKYKYDAQGNTTEELELTAKGEQKERIEYKYENGLKVEKNYYDSKNRLAKKKTFKYELRK